MATASDLGRLLETQNSQDSQELLRILGSDPSRINEIVSALSFDQELRTEDERDYNLKLEKLNTFLSAFNRKDRDDVMSAVNKDNIDKALEGVKLDIELSMKDATKNEADAIEKDKIALSGALESLPEPEREVWIEAINSGEISERAVLDAFEEGGLATIEDLPKNLSGLQESAKGIYEKLKSFRPNVELPDMSLENVLSETALGDKQFRDDVVMNMSDLIESVVKAPEKIEQFLPQFMEAGQGVALDDNVDIPVLRDVVENNLKKNTKIQRGIKPPDFGAMADKIVSAISEGAKNVIENFPQFNDEINPGILPTTGEIKPAGKDLSVEEILAQTNPRTMEMLQQVRNPQTRQPVDSAQQQNLNAIIGQLINQAPIEPEIRNAPTDNADLEEIMAQSPAGFDTLQQIIPQGVQDFFSQRNLSNILQFFGGTQGQIPSDIQSDPEEQIPFSDDVVAGQTVQAPPTPETDDTLSTITQDVDVDTEELPSISPTSDVPVIDSTPQPSPEDNISQLKQAQQAIIAASTAGIADDQDRQDYLAVTNALGEVPSFTDRKGTPGFFIPSEGQIPPVRTFSLENPTDSLIEAEKYLGELTNTRSKIQQQADKLFNSQQQVLTQLQSTLNDLQNSDSGIRKSNLSSSVRDLQNQLDVAIKKDAVDRKDFITQNASEIDAQIETTTRQMTALKLKQQQEFTDFQLGKGGAPNEEVERLVALDLPSESQTGSQTYQKLDKGRKQRYNNLALETRNNFVNQIDFTKEGLDLLAKNELGKGRVETILQQVDNAKRKGIELSKKEANSRAVNRSASGTASDTEIEIIKKQTAREYVALEMDKLGKQSMVDNLDWFTIPGDARSDEIVTSIKTKENKKWDDVIDNLVNEANIKYGPKQGKSLIERMLLSFNNNFDDSYQVYGVKFDSTPVYEKYQKTFLVRLSQFFLGSQ